MELKPITVNLNEYPNELHPYLDGVKLYDSSCSPEAKVIFIDKDSGYFLKSAPRNSLKREATMSQFFHSKGMTANVLYYLSDECDWMLTEKVHGNDGSTAKYIEQPERLCDLFAEQLTVLHSTNFIGCPFPNCTELYIEQAKQLYHAGDFDHSRISKKGFTTAEEAFQIVESCGHLLKNNTLIHGDYCLPNIIINDWKFSGFIDLGLSGVGDRHRDLFAAMVTFRLNLKTEKYNQRFFDAYGRDKIDEDMLRVVAACEVFG